MLNAFRHHGLYRVGSSTPHAVLTPASAQRLSASRIISGPLLGDPDVDPIECSTPFGITDYIGTSISSAYRRGRSAQRLSASRIISGGGRGGDPGRGRGVLNAFRHHGLYRAACMPTGPGSRSSAQRLSASRIISGSWASATATGRRCAQRLSASRIISGRFDVVELMAKPACAQRLSASRIISGHDERSSQSSRMLCAQRLSASRIISGARRSPRGPLTPCVLNAFRHHGLYRAGRAGDGRRYPDVLNAFRHHGLYRGLMPPRQGCAP